MIFLGRKPSESSLARAKPAPLAKAHGSGDENGSQSLLLYWTAPQKRNEEGLGVEHVDHV